MKNVLCTGSEGYIGSVLVPILLDAGYNVVGWDTNYFKECRIGKRPDYELIEKDIRYIKYEDISKYNLDAVIHLASLSNDPMGNLDPELTVEINLSATNNLIKIIRTLATLDSNNPIRFIFSSSCSAYGISQQSATETYPTIPCTPYAKCKVATEEYLHKNANLKFCPVMLRNATVFGWAPVMRLDLAVNNLTASAYLHKEIRLNSSGSAMRPFVHVNDVARAMKLMLEADFNLVYNQVFNIGSNYNNYKISGLADVIHNLVGCPVVIPDKADSDFRDYAVDFTKFAITFPKFRFSSIENEVLNLYNKFSEYNLSLEDLFKYTRLDYIKKLMYNGNIDKNLYWTKK